MRNRWNKGEQRNKSTGGTSGKRGTGEQENRGIRKQGNRETKE